MMKSLFAFLLLCGVAHAQPAPTNPAEAQPMFQVNPSNGYGALSATTTSAPISGMTRNAAGIALPATLNLLAVTNLGTADAALCPRGGTCTCPETAIAATNGVTLIKGGTTTYLFDLVGVAATLPTIVACSTAVTVQFQW